MTMRPGFAVRTMGLAVACLLWLGVAPEYALGQTSKPDDAVKETAKPSEVIELNTATEEQLATLPGVGPAMARTIVEGRPYKSLADLDKVKGMGEAKIAAIKDKVGFKPGPPSATTPAPRAETVKAQASTRGKAALLGGKKININTASPAELQALVGVGPARAKAIIDGRPYERIEDIMKVKGIKGATFEKLKDSIIVK